MKKKLLVLCLMFVLMLCMAVTVSAETVYKFGETSEGVVSDDGYTLTIRGTGIADVRYSVYESKFPSIQNVVVQNGITECKNLRWLTQAKKVDLSESLMYTISADGAYFPSGIFLSEVILPKRLHTINGYFDRISPNVIFTIYPTTTEISEKAFMFMPNATIRGYTGSYAETYADKHDIIFESIGHIDDYDGPKPEPVQAEVGETFTYKGLKYKVMSVGEGLYSSKSQVRLLGREKDSGVRISIPNTVLYKDQRFRVTSVYTKAFYKDTSLRGVTFGKWVNYIGSYSFYGCSRLSRISITGDSIFKSARESLTGIYGKCQVTVPKGKVASYRTALRKYGLPSSVKVMRA